MIAALYVATGGAYWNLPDVDPWDKERDARLYAGPWPVVAHPPCERWGRYARGGPNPNARRHEVGDDGGCFAAAIAAVRRWGGVLEHPEASHAWRTHGLLAPPREGGWVTAGDWRGWTCCVEQGHYGHRARKATWLYVCSALSLPSPPTLPRPPDYDRERVRLMLPLLTWGPSDKMHRLCRLDEGFHSREERRRAQKRGTITRLSKRQAAETPAAFRDVLFAIAATCGALPAQPLPHLPQFALGTGGEHAQEAADRTGAERLDGGGRHGERCSTLATVGSQGARR